MLTSEETTYVVIATYISMDRVKSSHGKAWGFWHDDVNEWIPLQFAHPQLRLDIGREEQLSLQMQGSSDDISKEFVDTLRE